MSGEWQRYDVVLRFADGGSRVERTIRVKDPEAARVRWQARIAATWPREWGPGWRPVPKVELRPAPERWSTSWVGPGRGRDSGGRYTGYSADTREGLAIAASKMRGDAGGGWRRRRR
jgi:hypothetical protein